MKPSVVFFGDSVPQPAVQRAMAAVQAADALMCVGTSLTVYSAYRFVRAARERGLPIAVVNATASRADADATLRVPALCGDTLRRAMALVDPAP